MTGSRIVVKSVLRFIGTTVGQVWRLTSGGCPRGSILGWSGGVVEWWSGGVMEWWTVGPALTINPRALGTSPIDSRKRQTDIVWAENRPGGFGGRVQAARQSPRREKG